MVIRPLSHFIYLLVQFGFYIIFQIIRVFLTVFFSFWLIIVLFVEQTSPSLGIMIIEGKHAEVGQGIFISDIQRGSAAEEVCDILVQINHSKSNLNYPYGIAGSLKHLACTLRVSALSY